MDLNNPNQLIVQLEDDYFSRCSVVDNDGNKFFLYTNIGAPNYRLISVRLNRPSDWIDVIPESKMFFVLDQGEDTFLLII